MPDRGGRMAAWVAAGATVLGTVTLLARRAHLSRVRALVGGRYDEASGRGRASTPASPAARAAGHETKDMRGGLMAKLALLLGSVAFCMVLAMVGLRIWIVNVQRDSLPRLTAVQTTIATPPDPQLQRDPLQEIANLQAGQARQLDGYGYVDDARTRARIPIERAMALTVGQPLAAPP